LKLFLNEISDAGIIALTEAIKTHPNLTHIDVSTNSFSSEGQQALIELAKLKPHLTIHNPQYDLTQENQQNLGRNTHGC
jgi:Ran GTPase-activating protein (RanGAP) involved in mRNA processing and transport